MYNIYLYYIHILALALPDGKEVEDTAARTQKALEALLNGKISAAKPTTVAKNNNDAEPTFIRYAFVMH